jgi:hypothetical protein
MSALDVHWQSFRSLSIDCLDHRAQAARRFNATHGGKNARGAPHYTRRFVDVRSNAERSVKPIWVTGQSGIGRNDLYDRRRKRAFVSLVPPEPPSALNDKINRC